jgi:hypothetical protein
MREIMNNNANTSNTVNKILFVTIIAFSLLVAIAYQSDDYFSFSFGVLLMITLILYAQNKYNLRELLHSCRWL